MKEQIKIEDTVLKRLVGITVFDNALEIANKCHKNDVRRNGEPYMNHVIRVAIITFNNLSSNLYTIGAIDLNSLANYVAVALLHDTVEDKHITLEQLSGYGFDAAICRAVDDLSRRKDYVESYFHFIMRVCGSSNKYSKVIKLSDLEDNMSDNKEGSQLDKYRLDHYVISLSLANEAPTTNV